MAFEKDEVKAERELAEIERLQNESAPENHPAKGKPESTDQEAGSEGKAQDGNAEEKPAQQDDGYKQRYSTLQGMMRAEREKWGQERASLLAQLEDLKARPEQNDSVEVDENYRSPLVTDSVRKSLPYRRMAELNGTMHAEVHFESLASMQQNQQPQQEKSVGSDFFANLDRLARGWRTLNEDQAFLASLAKTIPYSSGKTIQDRLDQAVKEQDAVTAAQIFLDYNETIRQPAPTHQSPDDLVVPPKRNSAAQTATENNRGRVYTAAEWNEGWKKIELGDLSSKDAAALELDLTNAPSEGRVVG